MSNPRKLLPVVKEYILFDGLYARAKQAIATYGGKVWTDTGEHDPGVTLMEGFCYSISDLAYRNTLPLTDLLTVPTADKTDGDGIFPANFGPQMALTSGPITAEDYRRALLDLTDSTGRYYLFRNVQLVQQLPGDYQYYYDTYSREWSFVLPQPADGSTPVAYYLRGNYALYLEPSRDSSKDDPEAQAALKDFLANNRNLGEAISQTIWVEPCAIYLSLTVELEEGALDVAGIMAEIYTATDDYISPKARRYVAGDLAAQGVTSEGIYHGPNLQHGWITELPPEVKYSQGDDVAVDLSHLPNVLLAIDGIKNVQSFSYWSSSPSKGCAHYPLLWWSNPIYYMLDEGHDHVVLITAGGEHVSATQAEIEARIAPTPVLSNLPVVMPYGRSRDVAQYHPVSDKIPPCYGLQQFPATQSQQQLYQFLLPFEQVMANACQQLAKLPQLLAFERSGSSVWGEQWPYAQGSTGDQIHAEYAAALKAQIQTHADDYDQELAILNHLLGYFGTQGAARMLDTTADEFLAVEQNYLGKITDLAYHRDNIRPDEVSALQKRIAARLGFGANLFGGYVDMSQLPFYLIEHRALLPVQPSNLYDAPIYPVKVTTSADQSMLTVVQAPSVSLSELLAGQLVDLTLVGGLGERDDESDYTLNALIVDQVDIEANSFSLSVEANPELNGNLARIVDAQTANKLYWKNCQIWLQDIDYPLVYAGDQGSAPTDARVLGIYGSFPYPAMLRQGDTLVINAIHDPDAVDVVDSSWQLAVTVKSLDGVAGSITVVKADGEGNDFPDASDATNYYWYIKNDFDRFSFVVSMVLNKAILPLQGDVYTTEKWIRQCVQAEIPAHVSVVIHWLSDVSDDASNPFSFQSFAQSYAMWQKADTAPSTATYQLLWQLALGLLPTRLIGIGAMVVANSDQRTDVIGADGSEWNVDVIVSDSLFFVPKTYVPS